MKNKDLNWMTKRPTIYYTIIFQFCDFIDFSQGKLHIGLYVMWAQSLWKKVNSYYIDYNIGRIVV